MFGRWNRTAAVITWCGDVDDVPVAQPEAALMNEVMGALLGRPGRWFDDSIGIIELVCQVPLVGA
jgi:hypothetical protein